MTAEFSDSQFSDAELFGYVDEALPAPRMTAIEAELRKSAALRERLAALCLQHESAGPGIGEIWRRTRLSCPTRAQLGSYLLGALPHDWHDYVQFHLDTIGCRYCAANLADLQSATQEPAAVVDRRQKYFESSAGHLRRV